MFLYGGDPVECNASEASCSPRLLPGLRAGFPQTCDITKELYISGICDKPVKPK